MSFSAQESRVADVNFDVFELGEHKPKLSLESVDEIVDFLFDHLGEYGDPVEDIKRCVSYAENRGGIIVTARQNEELVGVSIVNHTGMTGFIPENILVYIATHAKTRGQGIGKSIVKHVAHNTKGDIALHVEHDNPAKRLYERCGFGNKYLEMRLKRQDVKNL